MNRIDNIKAKTQRPGELVLTLLHMLSMRTVDVMTSVPRDHIRTALSERSPGKREGKTSKVRLRRGKCLENPLDCALCLQECPEGVFFTYPRDRRPGQVCDRYELVTAFKSRCTGCGICVDECPRGALRLG